MASKSDNIEYHKRVRMVQEWILQDHLTSDIISQCVARWGVSDRQGMRYLAEANKEFQKITEKKFERRLNYHLQRRNKMLRDMDEKFRKTPAGLAVMLDILEDIARLERMYTIKVDHGYLDKDGRPTDPPKQVMIVNGKEIEF